ncbi:MAG: hypothetical protein N2376_11940 [Clostridia bacterium]|nr:hypothetical protein [Clostridia bacterium]
MKKVLRLLLSSLILAAILSGCASNNHKVDVKAGEPLDSSVTPTQATGTPQPTEAATVNAETNKYGLKFKQETDHFTLSYFSTDFSDKDKECINKIIDSMESGYARMVENYKMSFGYKKDIEIHKDHKQLHIAMGIPDAPDWACGGYGYGKILAASPLLPTPMTNYDCLINTPFHEYVHLIVQSINPKTPRWLNEGIAFYEAKDHELSWVIGTVRTGIAANNIPSFDDLDTGDDFQTFTYRNGYQYMYTFIEFIVETYGYEKLCDFIKAPDDFKGVFGLSKDELWTKWVEYLKETYKK